MPFPDAVFHAKDATIAKRCRPRWTALFPFFIFHFSLCLSLTAPSGAILYSYLSDLCARCVKTSSFNQPTVNSEAPTFLTILTRPPMFSEIPNASYGLNPSFSAPLTREAWFCATARAMRHC
jgi:hypothetical protein